MTAYRFITTGLAVLILQSLLPFTGTANNPDKGKEKNKNNVTLEIDLSSLQYKGEKIIFTFYNSLTKHRHTDSADIGNTSKVTFKTSLSEPILAQLTIKPLKTEESSAGRRPAPADNLSVYIEEGTIKITAADSLKKAVVKGSDTHKDYLSIKNKIDSYDEKFAALYAKSAALRKENDTEGLREVRKEIDALNEEIKEKVYKGFIIQKGKKSPVAIYALSQYSGYAIDAEKVEPVYQLLGKSVKALPSGKLYETKIETAKRLEIGKYAIPFTQNDTADIPVTLASFKGKYVLIDFWASWCGPCRAENPNVVKAFQKYKDNDFTVLGISLDRPGQKEKWIQAIHDDELDWTHVSDLKFWDNQVAQLYDIKAIPQNLLIDRDGKIVARNIRGEELENTLSQIFSRP